MLMRSKLRLYILSMINIAKIENAIRISLFFFLNKKEPKSVEQILLVRLDMMGDLVISYPSLVALRELYPDSKIDVIVGSWNKPFAEMFGFDFVHVWNSKRLTRDGRTDGIILRFTKAILILYKYRKNSIVINLSPSMVFLFAEMFLGVRVRNYDRNPYRIRLGSGVAGHQSYVTLKICLGKDYVDFLEYMKTNWLPKTISRDLNSRRILLSPGSGNKLRRWSVENWRNLSRKLISDGYEITLIGSKGEVHLCNEISHDIKGPISNVSGCTSPSELVNLIYNSLGLIGCDSGPPHLSALIGMPTVALFGPMNPILWGVMGKKSANIYHERACSPCTQTFCPYDVGNRCMDDISVEEVYNQFKNVIGIS